MTYSFNISWPEQALWENRPCHWSKKARAKRNHLAEAAAVATEEGLHLSGIERPYLKWTFHPPDRRRRDVSNVIRALKAAEDGIAAALRVDDRHFLNDWPMEFSEPVKGGMIVVTVCEAGDV